MGHLRLFPWSRVDLCVSYRERGYLVSAERNGITPEGFDFDNSPFSYQSRQGQGREDMCDDDERDMVAIRRSEAAAALYVGAFLNISRVVEALKKLEWRCLGRVCGLEGEAYFGGHAICGAALINLLTGQY
jgi:2-phosphosulfolactate phosphatase